MLDTLYTTILSGWLTRLSYTARLTAFAMRAREIHSRSFPCAITCTSAAYGVSAFYGFPQPAGGVDYPLLVEQDIRAFALCVRFRVAQSHPCKAGV